MSLTNKNIGGHKLTDQLRRLSCDKDLRMQRSTLQEVGGHFDGMRVEADLWFIKEHQAWHCFRGLEGGRQEGDQSQGPIGELMGTKDSTRLLLPPQHCPLRTQIAGLNLEIDNVGCRELEGFDDPPVLAFAVPLKPQQEGRKVGSVLQELRIAIQVLAEPQLCSIACVVEVKQPDPLKPEQELIGPLTYRFLFFRVLKNRWFKLILCDNNLGWIRLAPIPASNSLAPVEENVTLTARELKAVIEFKTLPLEMQFNAEGVIFLTAVR